MNAGLWPGKHSRCPAVCPRESSQLARKRLQTEKKLHRSLGQYMCLGTGSPLHRWDVKREEGKWRGLRRVLTRKHPADMGRQQCFCEQLVEPVLEDTPLSVFHILPGSTAVLIPCAQPHTVAAPSAWPAALNLSRMMESHRNTTLC
jgi:hypothetical protein